MNPSGWLVRRAVWPLLALAAGCAGSGGHEKVPPPPAAAEQALQSPVAEAPGTVVQPDAPAATPPATVERMPGRAVTAPPPVPAAAPAAVPDSSPRPKPGATVAPKTAASAAARNGGAAATQPAAAVATAPAGSATASAKEAAAAPAPKPAGPPPLDLKALETRLRETTAIGMMTKLTLKNQVDELLDRFRAHYEGRGVPSLAELRQPYDSLILKVLSLLQDKDPSLATQIASSREAIWKILTDRSRFSNL